MTSEQLTLIQDGEFVVCEDVRYFANGAEPLPATPRNLAGFGPSLHATSLEPINTTKAIFVRLGNEIVPVPFLRSRERRAVTQRIRIDGALATRIASELGLLRSPVANAA